jgi:hypothetical protein
VSEELTNHIDELSVALQDRKRDQVANHIRTIPEQTLDALLRIEELLASIGAQVTRSVPYDVDDIPNASLTPQPTPLLDKLSEKKPEQRKKPKQL